MSCFALLDDCNATEAEPRSRLYGGYLGEHRCAHPTDLDACWQQVRADLQKGHYAVVLIDYEWAHAQLPLQASDENQASLRFL
jgi:para-aminobenzoate synthetase / 4-amino-4-deoxychorismate lyase